MSAAPAKRTQQRGAFVVDGVSFTGFQVKYIVDMTTKAQTIQKGSTKAIVLEKILQVAGNAKLTGLRLIIWFAYTYGLVEL